MLKGNIRHDRQDRASRFPCNALTAMFVSALCLAVLASGCKRGGEAQGQKKQPPVPVTVEQAALKDVPLEISTFGNVETSWSVAIKPQVTGELIEVGVKDGQEVKKGDPLFVIDRRLYEASLRQAEAVFAKDEIQMKNAETEVGRVEQLVKGKFAPQEELDRARTVFNALQAQLNVDRAAVDRAKFDLNNCTITSPLNGRAGSVLVQLGNQVKPGDTGPLVVINQLKPAWVSFSVPESNLAGIRRFQADKKLGVTAAIPGDAGDPEPGELFFIDNGVDASTGTIRLKATFENKNERLWPGQFVNVTLRLMEETQVVTVPNRAIQTGQRGEFVFVIKDDKTAEMRPVVPARTFGDVTVVRKGLAAGERVVTDGQLRVIPGGVVEIVEKKAEQPRGAGK
jgi:multidrug efflux system membrane fusion protein